MERFTIDESYIASLTQREYDAAATQDQDIDPIHRRDRIAVDDVTTPVVADSVLKRHDHVRLWNWVDGVVIGPARHEDFFAVHIPEVASMMGDVLTVTIDAVTDRAPLDPSEEPMPVIVEPDEDEPGDDEPPDEEEPPPAEPA